jgi:hypothetical protein
MESNYRNWIERGEAWQMTALFQYGMEHICTTEHVGLCFYEIRILKHFHFHLYKGDPPQNPWLAGNMMPPVEI